jgi:hypothetical protein
MKRPTPWATSQIAGLLAKADAALKQIGMRNLEQEIEAAVARGECHYWDTYDANGKPGKS